MPGPWLAVCALAVLALLGAAGPVLYRASWAMTGVPRAAAVPPARAADRSSAPMVFDIDATRSPPDDGSYSRGSKSPTAPPPLPLPQNCVLPRAARDAAIAIVGLYEVRAVSPVALGDQDETTEVVDIIVESGGPPLYLLLSADGHMIWRIRGDAARVSHAVLLASLSAPERPADAAPHRGQRVTIMPLPPPAPRHAGVVGLAPDRVSTVSREACFSVGSDPEGQEAARAAAFVTRTLGRPPAVVAATYEASAIRIPSGKAAMIGYPPAPAAMASSDDNWPDGVADIRLQDVVAAVPARAYPILPEWAGWIQLIDSGAVEYGEEAVWIVRPIERFPPGLGWGPPIVLGALVPMPAGSHGQRCIRRQLFLYLPFSWAVRGHCR